MRDAVVPHRFRRAHHASSLTPPPPSPHLPSSTSPPFRGRLLRRENKFTPGRNGSNRAPDAPSRTGMQSGHRIRQTVLLIRESRRRSSSRSWRRILPRTIRERRRVVGIATGAHQRMRGCRERCRRRRRPPTPTLPPRRRPTGAASALASGAGAGGGAGASSSLDQ